MKNIVVVAITNCPPKLRGDLSKWLFEVNTGVYTGNLSSRVRDAVWDRICQNIGSGSATMVFSAGNEQNLDFRVCNSSWTPVDYDGIKLMRRPLAVESAQSVSLKPGFSRASHMLASQHSQMAKRRKEPGWVIVDLETTGLEPERNSIIEIAALRMGEDDRPERFARLIRQKWKIPESIVQLTGITDEMLQRDGVVLEEAITDFLSFVGTRTVIGYNVAFDMGFLQAACAETKKPPMQNHCLDLMRTARRKIGGVNNYKLETLARYFDLPCPQIHRAMADCELVWHIGTKLNAF